MKSDISIIIVSYNTRSLLVACLRSIAATRGNLRLEVIVVDNASGDGSASAMGEFAFAHVIANASNVGFGAANNQGVAASTGRYVLLLNSDTEIRGNCLEGMLSFADTHPAVAAFGCRVLYPDGTLQRSCMLFRSLTNLTLFATGLSKIFPRSRFYGRELMSWWTFNEARIVEVIVGCFMLIRRSAIDEIGMFDERFFMYAEEVDWCKRLQNAGMSAMFVPDWEITHVCGASTAPVARAMIPHLWGSTLKFIRKHHSGVYYAASVAVVACFFASRGTLLSLADIFDSRKRERGRIFIRALGQLVFNGVDGLCAHRL